jgi:hypothetical protein
MAGTPGRPEGRVKTFLGRAWRRSALKRDKSRLAHQRPRLKKMGMLEFYFIMNLEAIFFFDELVWFWSKKLAKCPFLTF